MNRRAALVDYLRTCAAAEDWHACSDAANDLREFDAEERARKHPSRRDEVLPALPAPFVDERGSIQNLFEASEDEEPARGVAVIRSAAGSVRSNHWHRSDWHYLHVLEGHVLYEWRDAALSGALPASVHVEAGQTFFTPPHVWHRVTFFEDTVLISVSRLSRKHAEHEADLVRDPG